MPPEDGGDIFHDIPDRSRIWTADASAAARNRALRTARTR
jgi:hypothetical protein